MSPGENRRMQVRTAGVEDEAARVPCSPRSPGLAAKTGKSGWKISPAQLQGCCLF